MDKKLDPNVALQVIAELLNRLALTQTEKAGAQAAVDRLMALVADSAPKSEEKPTEPAPAEHVD